MVIWNFWKKNGTATDIQTIEELGAGTTALKTTIAVSEVYTIIAAPMAKDGSLVKKFVAMESFFYSGIGDTGSHPCDLTVEAGKYYYLLGQGTNLEVFDILKAVKAAPIGDLKHRRRLPSECDSITLL